MTSSTNALPAECHLPRKERFLRRFGDLMTCEDLAVALRYPSASAVKKAHMRGTLPVQLFRLPKRKEQFASTEAVVDLLDKVIRSDILGQIETKEDAMT